MGDDSRATKLANWITDKAVAGIPPLSPAAALALEYQIDKRYRNDDERIEALINCEAKKSFTSGFVTGLGGLLTLPLAVPSALGAAWVLQARLAGAIAAIYGHDPKAPHNRTLILLSLLGDSSAAVLKDVQADVGRKLAINVLARLPAVVLRQINRRVGLRLMARVGGRGAITLSRALPLFGGVISGGFDAYSCRKTGQTAKELFGAKPKASPKPRKPGTRKTSVAAT